MPLTSGQRSTGASAVAMLTAFPDRALVELLASQCPTPAPVARALVRLGGALLRRVDGPPPGLLGSALADPAVLEHLTAEATAATLVELTELTAEALEQFHVSTGVPPHRVLETAGLFFA